jgi:hypothetical protein
METRQTGVTFTGGALASFGYSFLFLVLFLLIIPGAWGLAPFALWWTANLAFDDGGRAEFTGRPGQVWVLAAVLAFLAFLPGLATAGMAKGGKAALVQLALAAVLFPLEAAVKLPLYRWFFENIRLVPGGSPRFTGTYGAYLGWSALVAVSLVTIIGWAFASVAMARWFCRHLESDAYVVQFTGTGWGLLWRGFVWLAGMVCILPLPWVFRSIYAWWSAHLVVTRTAALGTAQDEFPGFGTA